MLTRFCVGLEGVVFRSSFRHDTNFEMIYFLFRLQRFLFRLSFSQLFCSVILSFLSVSDHPVLTVPSCPGCHALAVLSRLSYTGCAVPGVLRWNSKNDRSVFEPCLRFSGFQRRLFLCIPAQTRDYNNIRQRWAFR